MPTRHGWTTLLVGAASIVIGRVFGLIELYVLGGCAVLAVVVAMVVVSRRLPAVQVRRVPRPALVAVGEPARVDVAVRNAGRTRTPYLELWEPVGQRGGAPMQLGSLPPGETAAAAYRVPTTRRGPMKVGPLDAERSDLLGLCVRTSRLAAADEVLVVPRTVGIAPPRAGTAGRLGQHLKAKSFGQSGGEFHALREYVTGDDPRTISWKASARSNELIVRQTNPDGLSRCTVILDDDKGVYTEASWEVAVSVAASVIAAAFNDALSTRLICAEADVRGPDVVTMSLATLARAEPSENSSIHRVNLVVGGHDGLGIVVLVTGTPDAPSVPSLRASLSTDDTLVVACATVAPTGGGFAIDATSLDSFQTAWSTMVSGRR